LPGIDPDGFLAAVLGGSTGLAADSNKLRDASSGGSGKTAGILTTDQNKESLMLLLPNERTLALMRGKLDRSESPSSDCRAKHQTDCRMGADEKVA